MKESLQLSWLGCDYDISFVLFLESASMPSEGVIQASSGYRKKSPKYPRTFVHDSYASKGPGRIRLAWLGMASRDPAARRRWCSIFMEVALPLIGMCGVGCPLASSTLNSGLWGRASPPLACMLSLSCGAESWSRLDATCSQAFPALVDPTWTPSAKVSVC